MPLIVTPLLLLLLYATKQKLTAELARLVYRCGGKQRTFIAVWSVIFLPGTIIHEISHFLAAAATGTRTGKIEIFPTFSERTVLQRTVLSEPSEPAKHAHVRLGSVQTQELNPLRGFLVGLAPLFVGLPLLVWLVSQGGSTGGIFSLLPLDFRIPFYAFRFTISDLLCFYLFFTVSNSLFPSWADMKQALPLLVVGFLGIGMTLLLGVDFSPFLQWVSGIAAPLQNALLISVGVDLAITASVWGINSLFKL